MGVLNFEDLTTPDHIDFLVLNTTNSNSRVRLACFSTSIVCTVIESTVPRPFVPVPIQRGDLEKLNTSIAAVSTETEFMNVQFC